METWSLTPFSAPSPGHGYYIGLNLQGLALEKMSKMPGTLITHMSKGLNLHGCALEKMSNNAGHHYYIGLDIQGCALGKMSNANC